MFDSLAKSGTNGQGLRVVESSSGTWQAVADVVTERVTSTSVGKLADAAVGVDSEIKLAYEGVTYAGSLGMHSAIRLWIPTKPHGRTLLLQSCFA